MQYRSTRTGLLKSVLDISDFQENDLLIFFFYLKLILLFINVQTIAISRVFHVSSSWKDTSNVQNGRFQPFCRSLISTIA